MNSPETKTILIAGGSGLIGDRLSELLESKRYRVIYLTRDINPNAKNAYTWDPEKKTIDTAAIAQADVIINLAGAGIADKLWTPRRKRQIVNSRIFSTTLLFETVASVPNKVQLIINASAIGIYGDSGVMILNEESAVVDDFLGKTCQRWEAIAHRFETLNIRTVIIRIGLVLSTEGGLLSEIKKPLQYGVAPVFGSGKQYQSWIHVDDLCLIISKAIFNSSINGVYNAVAPGPLSQRNFMRLLSQILGGGHLFVRIPAIFLKIFMGEMSKLVLQSARISCRKIEDAGFVFRYPEADIALRNLLEEK